MVSRAFQGFLKPPALLLSGRVRMRGWAPCLPEVLSRSDSLSPCPQSITAPLSSPIKGHLLIKGVYHLPSLVPHCPGHSKPHRALSSPLASTRLPPSHPPAAPSFWHCSAFPTALPDSLPRHGPIKAADRSGGGVVSQALPAPDWLDESGLSLFGPQSSQIKRRSLQCNCSNALWHPETLSPSVSLMSWSCFIYPQRVF